MDNPFNNDPNQQPPNPNLDPPAASNYQPNFNQQPPMSPGGQGHPMAPEGQMQPQMAPGPQPVAIQPPQLQPAVPMQPQAPGAPSDIAPVTPPVKKRKSNGPWKIIAIIFIILSLILGGAFGWAFMQYIDYRDNTNFKIAQAVADERKTVSEEMQKKFAEEAKSPRALFVGPDDYGRVTFEYPKNWSVYVSSEVASGTSRPFNAFFYPDVVPPVSATQQFALRMTIEDVDYDKAVGRYANQVKKGELHSSPVQVGLLNGTRLDGYFTQDIRGAAVMFKVRDKTLTLRTDSQAFMSDFDSLIKTIKVVE